MIQTTTHRTGLLTSVTLLSFLLLAAPAVSQTTAPQQPSATEKVAPGSPALNPKPARKRDLSAAERVDARITELHNKLKITSAQEPQWKSVADTMRGNARAMEEASSAREKALQTMTVMDDLRSYEGMASMHAEGLHKLVATFGPLYDGMSPEQKKVADAEFQGYRKRGPKRR